MKWILCILFFVCVNWVLAQDTINRVDANDRKYGYWKIPGAAANGYSTNAIAEEGFYVNGRKEGTWKTYFPNGKLKSVIPHVDGRPNGKFVVYSSQGCIAEKGEWLGHFEGQYLEHVNGHGYHIFNYNENGKQQGEQFYYSEYGGLTEYLIASNGNRQYKLKFDSLGKVVYIYPTIADTVILEEERLHPDFFKLFGCNAGPAPKPILRNGSVNLPDKTPAKVGESGITKLWCSTHYKFNKNGILVRKENWKIGRQFADVPTNQ